MRGPRAFIVLTVYLLILSCFVSLVYLSFNISSSSPTSQPDTSELGMIVFSAVVLIELATVTFISPAFTAGAITGERERKTFELLRTTLLPASKMVLGKLSSAMTYMLLLALAAVPLQSLAFMLGGVVVEELILALVIILVATFAFAAMGLFFSSLLQTTLASTVLTYVAALLANLGLPLLLLFGVVLLDPFLSGYSSPPPSWILEAALLYGMLFIAGLSPLTAAAFTKVILEDEGTLWFFWQNVGVTQRIPLPSPWIVFTVVYLALGLLFLLLAIVKVRAKARQ